MKFFKESSLLRSIHKLPTAQFHAVAARAHNYAKAVKHHQAMANSPFQRPSLFGGTGVQNAEKARRNLHNDFMDALTRTGVPHNPKRRDQAERAALSIARRIPKPETAGKLPDLAPKKLKIKKEWTRPPKFA